MRHRFMFMLTASVVFAASFTGFVHAQVSVDDFRPVTQEMLEAPDSEDWLMFSRTYDAQRYSLLDQIDTDNVGSLGLSWARRMGTGSVESIPLVHDGIMYVLAPGAVILALDATNGDEIWTYERELTPQARGTARSKNIAIYQDMI